MNKYDSLENIHLEIISASIKKGFDFSNIAGEGGMFIKAGRFIVISKEKGIFHYGLQGRVKMLPEKFKESDSVWIGFWHEKGTLENIQQVLELIKAWLLDEHEVHQLPNRTVVSCGI